MRVAIIGTGYVGLTTGVALATLGHDVIAVDKDESKLALLKSNVSPIHEPGLADLMKSSAHHLRYTDDTAGAVADAEVIIIAVGTPAKETGEADTGYVEIAANDVADGLLPGRTYTVVVKSTVPVGTNRRVAHVVNRRLAERGVDATVHFASNPEFLREGAALADTFYPDRIVIGADHPDAVNALHRLYRPLLEQTFTPPGLFPRPERMELPRLITTDTTSAEVAKYAANAFLALKVSFINEMAGLCEKVGANVIEVARGVGADTRIGPRFLNAGVGWGGSCFPKDTAALLGTAAEYGYEMPIVAAARRVNTMRRQAIVNKLQDSLKVIRGRTVAVLGLAFKPNTDDVRNSPSVEIIRLLLERGASIRSHDPVALENAAAALRGLDVALCADPYLAVEGADAVLVATGWSDYRGLDLPRLAAAMRDAVMVDGVNLFEADLAREAGFRYTGVGQG
jgi:UDPglucose 6-dehydrogenase